MKLNRIEEIKIGSKSYDVAFMPIQKTNISNGWVCAYVKIKGVPKEVESYNFGQCTYREGDVFGIDTNHHWNFDMSYEEREADAVEQIKELIKSINKFLKKKALLNGEEDK